MQVSLIGFCGISKVGDNKVYNNVLHFAKSTYYLIIDTQAEIILAYCWSRICKVCKVCKAKGVLDSEKGASASEHTS